MIISLINNDDDGDEPRRIQEIYSQLLVHVIKNHWTEIQQDRLTSCHESVLVEVSSKISSLISAREARFLSTCCKITLVCACPKMRQMIFILNFIQKIYMHWIRSLRRQIHLTNCIFRCRDSRIPIYSFRYFSTIKRSTVVHCQETSISSFPRHFKKRNQSLREQRWNLFLVPSTILRRSRKAVHYHKEFRWFSSWIIDVLKNRIKLTTRTSNGKTQIKTDFISNIN